MDAPLRWGILATGGIAEQFTRDLQLAGLQVQAVGSRSVESAQRFAERFGIAQAHGRYAALVADPDVDIIYIATPHPQHADNALLALEAGKHVLVEKPFTLNGAQAARVVALARKQRLVVLEAMWTRFLPHMLRIREIIAAGTIGQLRSIHAEHRQCLPTDPDHRINALALGGGALLDLGIYPVSFAVDLLGLPLQTQAQARLSASGVDAEIATLMRHAGNALSTSVSTLDGAGENAATVHGALGRIEIDATWYTPTSFTVRDLQGEVIERFQAQVTGRGMQFQAFEMEALVRHGGESVLMPPDQSVGIMRTLDAIRAQIGLIYPGD
ncbi:MAG: Gfo/Idh/MocA family oxidoreductase [Pseudoxanthomonas sp.]